LKEVSGKVNSKLKIFSVLLVATAIVGVLVYVPFTAALQAANGEGDLKGLKLIWWLLNNSEPVEIEGAAATYHKDFLMVNTDAGQVRIALPEEWTVGTDVVPREMLFESGYLSPGENVTVKALKTGLFAKTTFAIYVAIGYEIIDDASVHAYAALPVNIET
jgi:hypothetical protein